MSTWLQQPQEHPIDSFWHLLRATLIAAIAIPAVVAEYTPAYSTVISYQTKQKVHHQSVPVLLRPFHPPLARLIWLWLVLMKPFQRPKRERMRERPIY